MANLPSELFCPQKQIAYIGFNETETKSNPDSICYDINKEYRQCQT